MNGRIEHIYTAIGCKQSEDLKICFRRLAIKRSFLYVCAIVVEFVCSFVRFCKRAKLYDGQVVIFAHGELSGNHKPLSVRAGDRTVLVPIVNVSTVNLPPPDEEGQPQPGPAKVEFRNFMSLVQAFIANGGAAAAGGEDHYH